MREAGFDVLSIANNHILDYDSPALLDTIEYLREQGIDPVGAGKDLEEAVQPVIKEVNGYKFALLLPQKWLISSGITVIRVPSEPERTDRSAKSGPQISWWKRSPEG